MKKKITSLLCVAALCGATTAAVCPTAIAQTSEYADEVKVVGYETINGQDIQSAKELSVTDEWIYTMLYDRLLDLDSSGDWSPSIAEDWWLGYPSSSRSAARLNMPPAADWGAEEGPLPDLPDFDDDYDTPFDLEGCGFGSFVPTRGWNDFLGGPGPLILNLQIRDDIYFHDDHPLDAYAIEDWITYAQLSPYIDTVIYKQWQPVVRMDVWNESTISLYLSFKDLDYGFADFMYSLASPTASIARLNEEWNIVGSGAYDMYSISKEDDVVTSVTLKRYDDWWADTGSVRTEYVTFIGVEENSIRKVMYLTGEADIVFLDGEHYTEYNDERYDYRYISTNPIVAFYNPSSIAMMDINLRLACQYAINSRAIINYNNFSIKSNDFWAYRYLYQYRDPGIFLQQYKDERLIPNYDSVNLSLYVDSTFNSKYRVAEIIQKNLAEIQMPYYGDLSINCVIYDDNSDGVDSGYYDIIIKEIDLNDINSIYNSFKIFDATSDLEDLLARAKRAASEGSYFQSYYDVQKYCFNEQSYMTYLGWKNEVVATHNSVDGLSLPSGLSPLGTMSRLDFRFVRKN